jgi:hypothetical protein
MQPVTSSLNVGLQLVQRILGRMDVALYDHWPVLYIIFKFSAEITFHFQNRFEFECTTVHMMSRVAH